MTSSVSAGVHVVGTEAVAPCGRSEGMHEASEGTPRIGFILTFEVLNSLKGEAY